MRCKDDQVRMTSLNVQKCNSVKSVCSSTEREGEREEREREKIKKGERDTEGDEETERRREIHGHK